MFLHGICVTGINKHYLQDSAGTSRDLFVFLLRLRQAEMQQEKLILNEMQRRYEVELSQNIRPDDFDSLMNLKTRVGFNSTKCKIFHFGSDKNML